MKKQFKESIDLLLNLFNGYEEEFSVVISGDTLLHHKVDKSKYCKEWKLPKKNNWETTYLMEDGCWIVEIQNLNKNQIIELYELFDEEYVIYLSHSNLEIDELLFELFEMYYDDSFDITEWEEFLKNNVENRCKTEFKE